MHELSPEGPGYRPHPQEAILDEAHNSIEDGRKMMKRYLDRHGALPQSFITSSLPLLEGALNVISETYGHIPSELNIGTFDSHPMLKFLPNRIWVARQNEEIIVKHAFDAMMDAIKGNKEVCHYVVPMELTNHSNVIEQK